MTAVQKPLERSGMLEKSQLCCIQPTGGGAGEGAGRPVSNTGLVKAPEFGHRHGAHTRRKFQTAYA